eukprot:2883801-Rhodomonas_salina.1
MSGENADFHGGIAADLRGHGRQRPIRGVPGPEPYPISYAAATACPVLTSRNLLRQDFGYSTEVQRCKALRKVPPAMQS